MVTHISSKKSNYFKTCVHLDLLLRKKQKKNLQGSDLTVKAGVSSLPQWRRKLTQWQLRCHLLHKRRRRSGRREGRRRVRTSSDVAAVMKREGNDWRQEVEGGGSGALCIIHPCWHIRISDSSEEGHQSSRNPSRGLRSSVGVDTERHTMDMRNCKQLTRDLEA